MPTVLVVGATGNIGVSAVLSALRSGYQVLAVVRNQASADKMFRHVGTRDNITTVEADITSKESLQGVVDKVRAKELPSFQHVFASCGGGYPDTRLLNATVEALREDMIISVEASLFTYQASVPHLLEQRDVDCSWTICTGAQGNAGQRAIPAIVQGSLFSLCNAANYELRQLQSTIRFNELYLATRVEVDEEAEKHGVIKASDFSGVYVKILADRELKGQRVSVYRHNYQGDLQCRDLNQW